jgi:hypothetical protein
MKLIDAPAVLEILRGVPRPAEPENFNILSLAGNASLGKFGNGAPALFFELPIGEPGTSRTLVRGIELITSARFEILERGASGGRTRSGYAIALRELSLVDVFAAVVAHAVSRLCVDLSAFSRREAVERYLASWIEFFAPQSLSPERVIGLWGELYFLSSIPNLERGVVCWVGPYGQMFDFMGNGVSLEVKTSLRNAVATFSLAQIEGRDDGHAVFVRALKDDRRGRSIDELVAYIRRGLRSPIQFDATLVRTGYHAGANADFKLTAEDVRAVPNVKIPRPIVNDGRIQSVKFEVDVDGLKKEFVPVTPMLRRLTRRR